MSNTCGNSSVLTVKCEKSTWEVVRPILAHTGLRVFCATEIANTSLWVPGQQDSAIWQGLAVL